MADDLMVMSDEDVVWESELPAFFENDPEDRDFYSGGEYEL